MFHRLDIAELMHLMYDLFFFRSILLYFYVMEGTYRDDYIVTESDLARRRFIPGADVIDEWQPGQLSVTSTKFVFRLTNLTSHITEEATAFLTTTAGLAVIATVCAFIVILLILILLCCCRRRRMLKDM